MSDPVDVPDPREAWEQGQENTERATASGIDQERSTARSRTDVFAMSDMVLYPIVSRACPLCQHAWLYDLGGYYACDGCGVTGIMLPSVQAIAEDKPSRSG